MVRAFLGASKFLGTFLSDSCLVVIWPLGDRILPFLGILGEDLGYWSLKLRNCMSS